MHFCFWGNSSVVHLLNTKTFRACWFGICENVVQLLPNAWIDLWLWFFLIFGLLFISWHHKHVEPVVVYVKMLFIYFSWKLWVQFHSLIIDCANYVIHAEWNWWAKTSFWRMENDVLWLDRSLKLKDFSLCLVEIIRILFSSFMD